MRYGSGVSAGAFGVSDIEIYTQATMTQMAVRHFRGEAMEKTLAWAEGELEGYMRT